MKDLGERKYYVAIAGNIGVGKTTLTQALAEQLGWRSYFEPVINNPYLDDFYADMSRWAFHLQVYFLSKRFESQRAILLEDASCIQDRTIYEDVEIFAATLHKRGHLTERDWENYHDLFCAMTSFLRPPDLILYLRCDVSTLLSRIHLRGRESEKRIHAAYLEELNEAYEDWARRALTMTRFAVLDTGSSQELNKDEVLQYALDLLRTRLQLEIPFASGG
ncbi:MAG: deoxynucleoside kinase [bacterium]